MELITEEPIIPEEMFTKIETVGSGSLLFHYAVVKGLAEDKPTEGIRFFNGGGADVELALIVKDMRNQWNIDDVLLVRRLGTLTVGDIISLVGVSATRSNDAFEACLFGLERLKNMASINKRELYLET
ncbi:MAG: molybdenum cofactor biosynthesis protein MoaE [Candidatus Aquicultor sp.]